jgi:Cell wall-active antibiotics response 4TMS YvqF
VFGIALIVLAASILWGDWWSPGREWFLPIGLVALGAWLLFRRDEQGTDPLPPSTPAPPATPSISAWASTPDAWSPGTSAAPDATVEAPTVAGSDATLERPSDTAPGASAESPTAAPSDATLESPTVGWDPPAPPPPPLGVTEAEPGPAPPPAPRRRRIVRPIVFGTLLVWTGVAFLAGVTVQTGLAVAVLIVGAGFLLGAAVGGSRALVGPAVVLVLLLVATTVLDIPLSGPIGDREWAPQRIQDVEASYEVSLGEGTLDLTALELSEGDELEVAASVGIGNLRVEVPEGVDVAVVTELGAGSAKVFGVQQDGVGVSDQHFDEGGSGELHLDLHVGVGEIDVQRRP